MKVLVLNGPNLNMLGKREPAHYGAKTLDQINENLVNLGKMLDCEVLTEQSNAEHELVGLIQQAPDKQVDAIVINPGAFTHTSIAIRDAFSAVGLAFVEVHLSNVHAREDFRHHSYLSDIAAGVIVGLGPIGYELALRALIVKIQAQSSSKKS